jgi:hypothetical protein
LLQQQQLLHKQEASQENEDTHDLSHLKEVFSVKSLLEAASSAGTDEKEAEVGSTEAVTMKDLVLLRIRLQRKLQRQLLTFLLQEKIFVSSLLVVLKRLERT